jgi:RNA polymerase sigma-70 factor (ECF subfamily)
MVADAGRAAFAHDDQLAFADSLEPLLPIAFRLANGMLRNRDDAEDAVQEAAMKAWRKRSSFRAGSDPKPWFLAIVANECKMHRRRRVWLPLDRPMPEPEAAGLTGRESDDVEPLRAALAHLDRKTRLVLVLRFYLDLSHEDLGRTLGISTGAARVRVHRALEKLRPVIDVTEEPGDE